MRPIQPSNLLAKLDDFIGIFLIDLPAIIESYTIHTQPAAQPSTQLLLPYQQVKCCLLGCAQTVICDCVCINFRELIHFLATLEVNEMLANCYQSLEEFCS